MKKVLLLVLVLLISLPNLTSCMAVLEYLFPADPYADNSNWSCDTETFLNVYQPLYLAEIERFELKYGLEFERLIEYERGETDDPLIFLYNDVCTVYFELTNRNSVAWYYVLFCYYGTDDGIGEYEDFRPYVEFLNDFTNHVAYDTKTDQNHFERLYNEALTSEEQRAGDYYHYDSSIGNVGYSVSLHRAGGYYYKAQKDRTVEKNCHRFVFEGLLKPLI